MDSNGIHLHKSENKEELLSSTMESQFTTTIHSGKFDKIVQDTLATQTNAPRKPQIFYFPGEVWDVIKKLPNHRALGSEGITNCALK